MRNTIDPKNFVPWKSNLVSPGDRFGRLVVISTHKLSGTYRYYAKALCDCGNETHPRIENLRNGKSKSCGCLQREAVEKHGCWNHPIFPVWHSMMDRCYREKDNRYHRYGKRGITVCKKWHDPNNFIKDMYPTFRSGLTIDRINNDGNYCKKNCRWATRFEQARNRSNHAYLTYNGVTKIMADWCRQYHIKQSTLAERIKRGWSPNKALTTPVKS